MQSQAYKAAVQQRTTRRLESEQESQCNQRSTQTTPTPVLALRTASYCTENEGTPDGLATATGEG
jgi:hypothetical protein